MGKLTPGGDDMIAEKTSECGVATRQFRLGRVNGVDSALYGKPNGHAQSRGRFMSYTY